MSKPQFDIELAENTTKVNISHNYLDLDHIHKVFYKYLAEYYVRFTNKDRFTLVELKPKIIAPNNISGEALSDELSNDLIDAKTREVVDQETKNVKELIIAKAFFHLSD